MPTPVPAGLGKRLAAGVVDALVVLPGAALVAAGVQVAVGVRVAEQVGALPEGGSGSGGRVLLVSGLVLTALVGLVQWIAHGRTGWTVGKLVMDLRTVDVATGKPVGLLRILLRQVVLGVGSVLVLVSILVSARRRGWHDLAAGTLVREGGSQVGPVPETGRIDALLAQAPRAADPRSAPPPAAEAVPAVSDVVPDVTPVVGSPASPAEPAAPLSPDVTPVPAVPTVTPVPPPADVTPVPAVPTVTPPPWPGAADPEPAGVPPEIEVTRHSSLRRREVPEQELGVSITLSDGRRITVSGHHLLGRNPSPRPGEPAPAGLITVPDPGRSVSKTHLLLGVDGVGLWVQDRGSTNGTVVTLADGQQILCAADQTVRVPGGATASFGDHWFTVD